MQEAPPPRIIDPLEFAKLAWPHIYFYDKQREIIYSVLENDETYVPAGNMLGKDFVAGFIIIYFFMTRFPCRVITTSVTAPHLDVLWGEMNRYIQECRFAIKREHGGPLIVNHYEIKRWLPTYQRDRKQIDSDGNFVLDEHGNKIVIGGDVAPLCYIKGVVTGSSSEGLSGHHVPNIGDGIKRALLVEDEASGCSDEVHKKGSAWFNSFLAIGNCWECNNHFKFAVKGRPGTTDKGGDIPRDDGKGFHRRIIKIKATDSPNVRRGLARKAMGLEPDDKIIVPGVKSWGQYQSNLKLWDDERIAIGLNAEFFEGAKSFLYPKAWLTLAEELGNARVHDLRRHAKAIGVDCAEGGDDTALVAVDEDGVIDLISEKTPDTSKIPKMVLDFMKQYRCLPENVFFDRGGGGYQHVSVLNRMGFKVKSVSFGEAASAVDHWKYFHSRKEKRIEAEEKTIYKNRRAEMYGTLRDIINPVYETGFGIAGKFVDLHQQMSPIPLVWDEGKLVVPPKSPRPFSKNEEDQTTLIQLIGHSPDELDALCLAVYGMTHKPVANVVRSMV